MLCELGITPEVLAPKDGDQNPEVHDVYLRQLKDFLLEAGVLRDFRDGEWSSMLANINSQSLPKRTKELLKKLGRGRLRPAEAALPNAPSSDLDRCNEAFQSSKNGPELSGIITSKNNLKFFPEPKTPLTTLDKFSNTDWRGMDKSLRLHHRTSEYLAHLKTALECSTHVAFIDPYICPANYKEFLDLIFCASRADILEIHRSQFDGKKVKLSLSQWKTEFSAWDLEFRKRKLKASVYLWPYLHDRYLITNLVGISLPHGFYTTGDINQPKTTWSRLSREDRDDVQSEFDPSKAADHFILGELIGPHESYHF